MRNSIDILWGSTQKFVEGILTELDKLDLPWREGSIDHLCYRVSSYQRYAEMKSSLLKFGYSLTEAEVNGRPIICFKLFKPIKISFANKIIEIPIVELPAPKSGSSTQEGLEHIEIFTGYEPALLQNKFPHLPWKMKGLSKTINAELELEFSAQQTAVKFHKDSIEQVINQELSEGITQFIFEDEFFLAVDKPPGFFVQPPKANGFFINPSHLLLPWVEKKLGHKIYPVHRLDSATSGLTLLAKSAISAEKLNALFRDHKIEKKYLALVRGYAELSGEINEPLENPKTKELMPAFTSFECLQQFEIPAPVSKYPTSRYSLLAVKPKTGRWHQIRRHLDRINHPIVGDLHHGDGHHNRYFRDELGLSGLWLRAQELSFQHPISSQSISIKAPKSPRWERLMKTLSQFETTTK